MISFLTRNVQRGFTYVRENPNLILILLLILVLPVILWYTNQQYLSAGLENQDRLQKDRIGLMQDVIHSLLVAADYDPSVVQRELDRIAELNPDITEFRVAKRQGTDIVPIAALDQAVLGRPVENPQFYMNALVEVNDESLIFPTRENGERVWYTYRAIESNTGEIYFVYTKLSLASVDAAFAANTSSANWSFVYLYLFIIILAVWHIKMTDYRYLYQQMKKANEMKDLFTNTIAHELRAPLTAIRGYATMVEEKVEGEPKTYAQRVNQSSQRLIAIVNDLLDVARLQSGKLSVEKAKTDLSPVISAVLEELRASAEEKSLELLSEGTDTAHVVQIDETRFHQALSNLVSNAIKYTQAGSVTVALSETKEKVEVRVKDTGMGIESADQKKLFAPFFRVDSTDVSQITGTGLGMWITQELIERMGGTIGVESIKDVGTHVVISLPKGKDAK